MVFGRAGEEAEELSNAGIPFEICLEYLLLWVPQLIAEFH